MNTVRHARRTASKDKVHAIIGGFHLSKTSEERVARTVDELMKLDLRLVAPCHCTGTKATGELIQAFGDRCRPLQTGR
ncbi:MAG: hypothetical protein QW057_03565 [Candidatus Bathyarchaeia archaeon]